MITKRFERWRYRLIMQRTRYSAGMVFPANERDSSLDEMTINRWRFSPRGCVRRFGMLIGILTIVLGLFLGENTLAMGSA